MDNEFYGPQQPPRRRATLRSRGPGRPARPTFLNRFVPFLAVRFDATATALARLARTCAVVLGGVGVDAAWAQATAPAAAASAPQRAASAPEATPVASTNGARFAPTLRSSDGAADPIVIEADRLSGRPDLETIAEGGVQLRRGPFSLKADRIEYQQASDLVRATGEVEIRRNGNVFSGPEVQLKVQRFEGFFLSPKYHFERTDAGGSAERFVFLDESRGLAYGASYTSCPAPDPAWELKTDRVLLDTAADIGVAEGAVLRFYGVPILAAPSLSFPLSDARKSGWLPPGINLDSKSGVSVAAPYYWNIAPNRDATFVPELLQRRGAALGSEFRYLEPSFQGEINTTMLPGDRVADRDRWSLDLGHQARWDGPYLGAVDYGLSVLRVSDSDYWKDFAHKLPTVTPRLLPTHAYASRRFDSRWGDTQVYARVQRWQVLQDRDLTSRIVSPYQREPQVGVRQRGAAQGFEWTWETEGNEFTNDDTTLITGSRAHALGSIARPWSPIGADGWVVTPRLSLNAASYRTDTPMPDGRTQATRTIPTVSLDSTWVLERDTVAFGRPVVQTLEPRLLYVNTPFRDQSTLPNYDSAPNDFNLTSIYADNAFSGIDRVSDANQLTAGVTTRFLDRQTGAEALRLGLAQRLLLRPQRVTPDGLPNSQRWSDVLLFGATSLVPNWWLDSAVQYNGESSRTVRSLVGARYSPGPFRTINMAYRFTRDSSEQIELGWQWPINQLARDHAAAAQARDAMAAEGSGLFSRPPATAGCSGAWYSVGRINYSRRDSRITDSIFGVEYDSGCWIGRIVAERLSTGRSEATTRLLLQLELVGLSRLGSNPLRVLKENVPGYRLLRDDASSVAPAFANP
jgi:LPS-assembly protein